LTNINVSGDTNVGNKVMANVATSLAFDFNRISVFSTNTASDSVTQVFLNASTAGFAINSTTISLEAGSQPIGMSFEYYGSPYTQDFVVNSGTHTATCPLTGSVTAIAQASAQVKATICVGPTPVLAWIYKDQTKIFVPDSNGTVYVVSIAGTNPNPYQITHRIITGASGSPIKVAQSNDGQFIYVLNGAENSSESSSLTIIDGQAETVVATVTPTTNPKCISICDSPLIDIAQDLNFNDTTADTQVNHIWLLHANGTVSVYDGTDVATTGTLTWITSLSTTATVFPTAIPTNLALMRDGTQAFVGVKGTDKIIAIDTSRLALGKVTLNATTPVTVGIHLPNVQTTLTNKQTYTFTYIYKDPSGLETPTVTTQEATYTGTVLVGGETTPTVTNVAVSRGGNSADLSKVYATTTTSTIYYCYDYKVTPTPCSDIGEPWTGGNSIVTAVSTTIVGTSPTPPPTPPPPAPVFPQPAFLGPTCTSLGINSDGLYSMSCSNLYNGTSVVAAAGNGTTLINTYVTTIPAPSVTTYCDSGNPATGEFDGQKNCPAMTPVAILGRS
jgi:Ni,Fe-hydrogenase III small subunit